jgi:hypothetical protein
LSAAKPGFLGAWPVTGNLQVKGGVGELLFPVRELLVEDISLKPLSLPCGIIGISHRQIRKLRIASGNITPIKLGELPEKYAQGPCINNDMVEYDYECIFAPIDLPDSGTQQRPLTEIKPQTDLILYFPPKLGLCFASSHRGEVLQGYIYRR